MKRVGTFLKLYKPKSGAVCARSAQDGNLCAEDGKPIKLNKVPKTGRKEIIMAQKIERKAQATKKFEGYKDGVKITWRNPKEEDSLLALLTATVSGITVYGCKLFMKKDGTTFVAMPSQKNGDKYYNLVFMSEDLLDMLNDWAVSAYNNDNGVFDFVPLVKGGK